MPDRNDPKPKTPQLGRDDWVRHACALLIEGGIERVQITQLARRLHITRGSFYWHFDNRDALLDAMVAAWKTRNTGVMLRALADPETLDAGILALFAVWVDKDQFDPDLDQAMRDWGRGSDRVARQVQAEDAARIAAISAFLARFGFAEPERFIRARVIYFTQVSYYALQVHEPFADRLRYLDAYFNCFIGRDADASAKAAFAALHLEDSQ